jgi:serine/threonine protein phosphatase PrpC
MAGGFTAPKAGQTNADGLLFALANAPDRKQLLVAAVDGNSGNGGAKIASGETLNVIGAEFAGAEFRLLKAAQKANDHLLEMKPGALNIKAGTTLVAALIDLQANRLQVVHLGDSRAYLYRSGELWMLTRDYNNLDEFIADKSYDDPRTWSPTFRAYRELLGHKNPAQAYRGFKYPLSPRLSKLVHDLGLEYGRAQYEHKITGSLGWPVPDFSHLSYKLRAGDWIVVMTDGGLRCRYDQLTGTIAANRTQSPYQLSSAIARMLAANGPLNDDITIAAYHHG